MRMDGALGGSGAAFRETRHPQCPPFASGLWGTGHLGRPQKPAWLQAIRPKTWAGSTFSVGR